MMDISDIFWIAIPVLLILMFIGSIGLAIVDSGKTRESQDQACISIGYEKAHYKANMWYCLKGNEAQYAIFDCKGFWPFTENRCTVQPINVGDVRVVE